MENNRKEYTMGQNHYQELEKAVFAYDQELSLQIAKQIIQEQGDVHKALDVLTNTIRKVGDEYAAGNFFLPDLIGASTAMLSALPILEEEIKKSGEARGKIGKVVIGTVYGDIHNIGKAIVSTLLMASGFEVFDLGTNIKPERFIEEVTKQKAEILAMSALMTTTAPEQKATIELLKEKGLRESVIVMVGGSAINDAFAEAIGADGYAPTAPEAVELAKTLLTKQK